MWGDRNASGSLEGIGAGDTNAQIARVKRSLELIDIGISLNVVIYSGVGDITDNRELAYGVACIEAKAVVVKVGGYGRTCTLAVSIARTYVGKL